MDLNQEAKVVGDISSRLDYLEKTVQAEEVAIKHARGTLEAAQSGQEILQLVAQAVQQRAHEKIASVVTTCLRAVFDDPYSFKIQFDRKRGRTEASLRFTRRGLDVDPLSASGGGVVDVAAFALRVSCLMLHRPRLRKLIVLDEPFRFVSAQYQPNVRQMLEDLSEKLGLQMLVVTHNSELVSGKRVEIRSEPC